jgi:hypothetical protein
MNLTVKQKNGVGFAQRKRNARLLFYHPLNGISRFSIVCVVFMHAELERTYEHTPHYQTM